MGHLMNTVTALRDWVQRYALDWFYDPAGITHGRRYFDGLLHPFGFTVWAGRRHLVLDFKFAQNAVAGLGLYAPASSAI